MTVLFIGKRFYTHRDALSEKYGRIWQLPWCWGRSGIDTRLWLVDYHTRETIHTTVDDLPVDSTPVKNLALFGHWLMRRYRTDAEPDVVVASGDCYIGWLGLSVARRLRARFVFDVYDKYDEFGGYHSPPGFNLFAHLLAKADVCLFASRALMQQMGGAGPSLWVPNGIDTALFKPLDKAACRRELGLAQDATYVGYVGSVTADRGVDDLVTAVQLLRDDGQDVRVLLAGDAAGHAAWTQSFVTNLGNVPYARAPVVMGCCDVLALPYRHSAYLDMASSCKIPEYLAAARPLAATDTPNLAANYPRVGQQLEGRLAEPSNPGHLAQVIAAQLHDPQLVPLPDEVTWDSIAGRVRANVASGGVVIGSMER